MTRAVTGAQTILSLGEPMAEFAAARKGPLAEADGFVRGWGGDTSNFAVAVARLGGASAYMCRLGDDDFGRSFLNLWQREGVDTSRVRVIPGGYTAVYFISYREDGRHDFSYIRKGSAASTLEPADIRPELFAGVAAFHTSGITQAISTSACDAALAAMELARKQGALVTYDPNLRLKLWGLARARAVVMESAALADVVLPSLDEAQTLTGLEDPVAIAERFLERGPRIVALKLGGDGCLVATREGQRVRVGAYRVQTVDTGGAGDTFDGGFVVSLVEGKGIEEAARFAAAAAALTTTGVGCVTPIPRREQVLRLMGGSAAAPVS